MILHEQAYAKLNLTLDVLGGRPDGYHDLQMVMQTVSLCDEITITLSEKGDWTIRGQGIAMPEDATNLAWRAAEAYFADTGIRPGLAIEILKRIPSQAGLAGGSADAAAVLRALNRHYALHSRKTLSERALRVGSDVPYCLEGGTKLAEGRGERLTPLRSLPDCTVLVAKPQCAISTGKLFAELDAYPIDARPQTQRMIDALSNGDLSAIGELLCNVFEPLAKRSHPQIEQLLAVLWEAEPLGAAMTGTGSACFAIFEDAARAKRAAEHLSALDCAVFLTNPV